MCKLDDAAAARVNTVTVMQMWAMAWSQKFGIPVLPCGPDKAPLVAGGKAAASRDAAQVRTWWEQWPDALIGGRTDGLTVLDFDAYKDGHAHDLEQAGYLPPTRMARTPGRNGISGRHVFFRGARTSGKIGKTIDIRGGLSGDYVILHPSRGTEGSYEMQRWYPLARTPDWLRNVHRTAPTPVTADRSATHVVVPLSTERMTDDERSEWTYRIFRNGIRRGLTDAEILAEAEADDITAQRRAEGKRSQPGWWEQEAARCLERARNEVWFGEGDDRPTAAQVVLQIARREYEFGQTMEHAPFAVPRNGPRIAQIFRGRDSLKSSLAMLYEQQTGHPVANGALLDALRVLEGVAQTREPVNLPLRVAGRDDDMLVLDLGTMDGRAVTIRPEGWQVVPRSPVLFLRTDLTAPCPVPVPGGRLATTLLPLLNMPQDDRQLVAAIILSWLWPDIDHPVIYLQGQEGTSKSMAAELLRSLVDPSTVTKIRQPPRDEDWEVTIAGQWGILIDNLSSMPEWLSDAICLATDETGSIKRRKYSDQDLSVVRVRRCFILTSIDQVIQRGDLIDRTTVFEMQPLQSVRTKTEIRREWEQSRPQALGALLDLACQVLRVLPDIRESGEYATERMAEFVQIAAAMDKVAGTHVVQTFRRKVAEGIRSTVESDPFAVHLMHLSENGWTGSPQALFDTYKARLGRVGSSDHWPKSPVSMGMRIRRISGILRKSGVLVEQTRGRKSAVIRIYRHPL